ncbi:hypothetical protein ACHAQA_005450 [Verticillium albo-atrum]
MTITPSLGNIGILGITVEELEIITYNGKPQHAVDKSEKWTYASRRDAQSILDWLYLGPSTASRDQAFLQREGITMVLAVRHASDMTTPNTLGIMGPTAATRALGIPVERIDVKSTHHLIKVFTSAVKKINSHLLDVHQRQINSDAPLPFERGKVLVICETGNDRSAIVVAAYIMIMFGMDLLRTIAFVTMKRFSSTFDEESKRLLRSWLDILTAESSVNAEKMASGASPGPTNATRKRGIEAMFDVAMQDDEDDDVGERMDITDDQSRFGNRSFVPFIDAGDEGQKGS